MIYLSVDAALPDRAVRLAKGFGAGLWPPLGGRRDETTERRSAKMICVSIEVREGALTRRIQITAPSIERALEIASAGKPGREVRLLPINPQPHFVPEDSGQREAA